MSLYRISHVDCDHEGCEESFRQKGPMGVAFDAAMADGWVGNERRQYCALHADDMNTPPPPEHTCTVCGGTYTSLTSGAAKGLCVKHYKAARRTAKKSATDSSPECIERDATSGSDR